ncbi:hypothetical protein EVAR_48959_1 [Eumeta japonica]|uniref:Uncharacterized protein n=1 Tax=Eumeta variegata TaxID=151549 RepID=A0A4C1Y401_EUMVA|nr:hypothetical protein EVAR_48959_1 [Eumeta japonica]
MVRRHALGRFLNLTFVRTSERVQLSLLRPLQNSSGTSPPGALIINHVPLNGQTCRTELPDNLGRRTDNCAVDDSYPPVTRQPLIWPARTTAPRPPTRPAFESGTRSESGPRGRFVPVALRAMSAHLLSPTTTIERAPVPILGNVLTAAPAEGPRARAELEAR